MKEKEVLLSNKKISILGAGPAGSTAAYFLAANGFEVEIIDRVNFPRNKPCAGGLFNPLLYYEEFPYLKEGFETTENKNKMKKNNNFILMGKDIYCVKFICGEYSVEYTSDIPLIRTLLRKDFDYFLLKNALKAGAKFFIGKKPDGDIKIIATGAKKIHDYSIAGICMVNDFPIRSNIDKVYIHYGFGGIRGYAWLFPKNGYVNIGFGAYLPQRNIQSIYHDYIDYLEREGIVSIEERKGEVSIIPFSPLKQFYTKDSLIVGDAAGFVNTSTGEGIFFAMLSGKIAARTIIEQKDFPFYQKECIKAFGDYLRPTFLIKRPNLLNWCLKKVVKIASKDETFLRMLTENFFRTGKHRIAARFLRKIYMQ